jgi:Sulfotransferase family
VARRGQTDAGGLTKAGRRIELQLGRIEKALATQSERNAEALTLLTEAGEAISAGELSLTVRGAGSPDGEVREGLERHLGLRGKNVAPVDQPLALICQAQRSGGTLLARLFDGHPQCHAHPDELHIGDRRPHVWPALGLAEDPELWFVKLQEERLVLMFDKGRRRIPLKAPGEKSKGSYPFLLPPSFHRLLFLEEVERRAPISSERQILDCYMTSLFNAWLDNQNLRGPEKRWVVAFSPRRAWGEGREKLFELYPDGRLISILRDPLSWYTSAQGRDPAADPEALLELWTRSAREMVEAKGLYPDRVFIVRFDELVRDTDATMRGVAGFLEIDFDPVLTTPTFNGYPVGANSSYEVRSTGVVTDPVERYKEILSAEQRKRIESECDELHKEALALVESGKAAEGRASTARARSAPRKGSPTRKGSTARTGSRRKGATAKRSSTSSKR